MLTEQAVLMDSIQQGVETLPLGFIISEDGRTLFAVIDREDGVLEFIATTVAVTHNGEPMTPGKTADGNIILNSPILQINLEDPNACEVKPTAASLLPVQGYQALPVVLEDQSAPQLVKINRVQPIDDPISEIENLDAELNVENVQENLEEISESLPPDRRSLMKRGPGRPRKEETGPPLSRINNFKCDICGQTFTKQMLLRRHMEHHAEEKPHRCPKCPASFNVPTNFTLHMATHGTGEPRCPECGRRFARMASLKSHMLLHEREENLFCTECEDAFSTKAQLDAHLKLHNERWTTEDVRKCKLCNKQFTQPALYRLHIREHYRLQTKVAKQTRRGTKHKTMYKCKICLKSFQKPSQLMRHIRVHTGEKPFKCTICARGFTQKGSLQIHMWRHKGIRPHACVFCNARFSQKGNLNSHITRVHNAPEGEPIYGCTHCTCVFRKLGSLNSHMKRMHSTPVEAPPRCDSSTEADMQATVDSVMSQLASLESTVKNTADSTNGIGVSNKDDILQQALDNSGLSAKDKSSASESANSKKSDAQTTFVTLLDKATEGSTKKYVTIKQRSIGNVRWYSCSFCHKEFKKPSDLIRHLRVHTQEKPFKCSSCFRTFALKSTMRAHERTHTATKKYTCGSCNKVFSCHSSLSTHVRQHTRAHICEVCEKSFATHAILRCHMKTHSRGKPKVSPEAEVLAPQIVLEEPLLISDAGNKISVAHVQSKQQQVYNDDVPRPHKCWACPAAFRKISHLKQHYRRHTGERPYKCPQCDGRFTSNSVLKSHLHTHEDSRPFTCTTCPARFSTHSSMKRHMVTHSNKRPFMCPYCHKTFKTSVNCRKHMKIHKHELAQQQLDRQKTQQDPDQAEGMPTISGSLGLTEEIEVTFQPQMAPDFSQAFSDQFQTIPVDKGKPFPPETTTPSTGPPTLSDRQNLAEVDTATLGSSQTLHADETGTITLPNYSGDQTLTPESIREIEETLNQQLFDIGMNLGLGNNLSRQIGEANPADVEIKEQPVLSIIYENGKGLETQAGTNIFPSQFDTFDMSHIALQTDAEIDIAIGSNSANMASILPRSAQEEEQLVPEVLTTLKTTTSSVPALVDDGSSKGPPRHLMVVSSVKTCPELSRPVQACRKFAKVIAKADTTDSDLRVVELDPKDPLATLSLGEDENVDLFVCRVCDDSFRSQEELAMHEENHNSRKRDSEEDAEVARNESSLQCHMCSRKGFSAAALKEHLKTHCGAKEFQCPECCLKFCTNGGLSRHLKMHASKQQWKCPDCGKAFANKLLLKSHRQTHEDTWTANAVEADSSQKDPLSLENEFLPMVEVMFGKAADQNEASEKVFLDKTEEKELVNRLVANGQNQEKKEYSNRCRFCPKSFRKPSDLTRHVRTHTGERPFQCDHCKKSFAVKCTLDCHMKVHTGKKTFSCHVCNSLFATKGSLKVHMRLHTGSKPFRCPLCDLRFRTSGHRKVHVLTHMREHKGGPKRKPKQLKVAAIAGVAAELEKTVESGSNGSTQVLSVVPQVSQVAQIAEYPSLESITIDASSLTDQLTLNGDGTILNNNALLSVNESNQLVANLQFLLANGLVTIQAEEGLLPHLQGAAEENGTTQLVVAGPQGTLVPVEASEGTPQTSDIPEEMILGLPGEQEVIPGKEAVVRVEPGRGPKAKASKECDICGKTFTKPCQVERHRRIHTGERPFKCELCAKSFAQKITLQTHRKHHTGDRPHPCPHCDHSFTQKGNLRTHLRRVHRLDTLETKKLKKGPQMLGTKSGQENLEEARILSLDDISFVDFLK
ncbi:zinc finger protein 236 [Orussus abietinus]|uniref:zinc finger protein 236 n=1 Tax=Orussus abietinus TaxID=222816 RepID=UPI00062597D0|nr:zinc finger protein 236 [Orussus abietinus]XP_012282704.1 zinc finger protein 236 [Orussus abietinus]